jgi:cytidylate kinase
MTAPLKPIIAIDGPAGSGKSTVAKLVAKRLNLFYIDTGAMYRALALKAKQSDVSPNDEKNIIKLAASLDIGLDYNKATGYLMVTLDGRDVSEEIRKPYITESVSFIAMIKNVREHMVRLQRRLAEGKEAVLEGRDITTVVFPDAYKKFYLDADPQERIKRRYLEMKEKNIDIQEERIREDIVGRDKIDSTRACAPLKRSPDAIYIDTTQMSIEEVVETVIREVKRKP